MSSNTNKPQNAPNGKGHQNVFNLFFIGTCFNVLTTDALWIGSGVIERMIIIYAKVYDQMNVLIATKDRIEFTQFDERGKSIQELLEAKLEMYSTKLIRFNEMRQTFKNFFDRKCSAEQFNNFIQEIERKTNAHLGITDHSHNHGPQHDIVTIDLTGDDNDSDGENSINPVDYQPSSEEDFFARGTPFNRGVPQGKPAKK